MLRAAAPLALALALAVPGPAAARRPGADAARGVVVLAGERVPVRWTDGDTFRVRGGRFAGRSARLLGVNALETYGPVHRIGRRGPRELLALARETAGLAASRAWSCETDGRSDGYGRLLVRCDDAAEALVLAGHALVFAVDGPADERLLAAQRRAQEAGAGMWSGGAPPRVPTSLHSEDEPGLGPRGAYDRVADTRSGLAEARPHARRYVPCEEVCLGEGDGRACLVYVPYPRRFRDRPSCLR
jgi:endonuclease YncB( thermonuclease family)